ncbi:NAD-dependent epimerase/dehydratase family protein [Thomasclavelia cocleata]|uniref:NAD-dependent epimerase/dehydratase family protein n=1 Tax=Thomasclavelia cocleata TaxID=69824 RepID=UPI0025582F57|nr:NAD-dependent epimerase/dehydratase family protein [Thomasclavelia cocleata]
MKVLITGAKGFVGQNLVASLKNIGEGNDKIRNIVVEEIYEYDIDSTKEQLDKYCSDCGFVFNLAGVNRPKDQSEFMEGNFGFANMLLDTLKKYHNKCGVMLSSSIQAALIGRYADSDYGKSKLAGEKLFFDYANEIGINVYVYRFPNLFRK